MAGTTFTRSKWTEIQKDAQRSLSAPRPTPPQVSVDQDRVLRSTDMEELASRTLRIMIALRCPDQEASRLSSHALLREWLVRLGFRLDASLMQGITGPMVVSFANGQEKQRFLRVTTKPVDYSGRECRVYALEPVEEDLRALVLRGLTFSGRSTPQQPLPTGIWNSALRWFGVGGEAAARRQSALEEEQERSFQARVDRMGDTTDRGSVGMDLTLGHDGPAGSEDDTGRYDREEEEQDEAEREDSTVPGDLLMIDHARIPGMVPRATPGDVPSDITPHPDPSAPTLSAAAVRRSVQAADIGPSAARAGPAASPAIQPCPAMTPAALPRPAPQLSVQAEIHQPSCEDADRVGGGILTNPPVRAASLVFPVTKETSNIDEQSRRETREDVLHQELLRVAQYEAQIKESLRQQEALSCKLHDRERAQQEVLSRAMVDRERAQEARLTGLLESRFAELSTAIMASLQTTALQAPSPAYVRVTDAGSRSFKASAYPANAETAFSRGGMDLETMNLNELLNCEERLHALKTEKYGAFGRSVQPARTAEQPPLRSETGGWEAPPTAARHSRTPANKSKMTPRDQHMTAMERLVAGARTLTANDQELHDLVMEAASGERSRTRGGRNSTGLGGASASPRGKEFSPVEEDRESIDLNHPAGPDQPVDPRTSTRIDQRSLDAGTSLNKKAPKLQPFSGRQPTPVGEIDWEALEWEIERLRERYTESALTESLLLALRGSAQQSVRGLGTKAGLSEMMEKLSLIFAPVCHMDSARSKFFALTQTKEEDVATFNGRLETHWERWTRADVHLNQTREQRDRVMKERFYGGLRRQLMESVRYLGENPSTSFRELYEAARRVEDQARTRREAAMEAQPAPKHPAPQKPATKKKGKSSSRSVPADEQTSDESGNEQGRA